jgi:hypothetical protein
MIFLFQDKTGGVSQIYNPEGLSQEQIDKAIKVESLPEKQDDSSKNAVLRIVGGEPVWEYIDNQKDSGDALEQRVARIEKLLMEKKILTLEEILEIKEEMEGK